jgi:hypothetical protein
MLDRLLLDSRTTNLLKNIFAFVVCFYNSITFETRKDVLQNNKLALKLI